MKILREHINEKFTEDSDPIHDMNIGMIHQIKLWMKSIDQPFKDKDNALAYCAGYGKLDFVEYLLAAGADVHASYDFALRWASDKGHTEMVKVLLTAGADVHAMDDDALHWASDKGHTEVVKVLLAAGADVHAYDDGALRWASENEHTEVVKVLKDHIAKEKRKKVKESVNEKFTEDYSDPIHDMGIGLYTKHNFYSYEDAAKFILKFLPIILELKKVPKDIINDNTYYIAKKYHEKLDNYLCTYININNKPIKPDSRSSMTGSLHNKLYHLLKEKNY